MRKWSKGLYLIFQFFICSFFAMSFFITFFLPNSIFIIFFFKYGSPGRIDLLRAICQLRILRPDWWDLDGSGADLKAAPQTWRGHNDRGGIAGREERVGLCAEWKEVAPEREGLPPAPGTALCTCWLHPGGSRSPRAGGQGGHCQEELGDWRGSNTSSP